MKNFLTEIPIAHRGLHREGLPENSMGAFAAAVEAGYAIETDVRFTKDRKLVLFHDDDLRRLTGNEPEVLDCTFAELKELRLEGTDEQIPAFEELLRIADGKAPLLIEIKSMNGITGKEIAEAVAAEIDRVGFKGEYAIQSFNPDYVKSYKKIRPKILCGILSSRTVSDSDFKPPFRWFKKFVVRNMALNFQVKPDFISYLFSNYPNRLTDKFKGPKLAWTVRSPEDEAYARKYADNIIFENFIPKQ